MEIIPGVFLGQAFNNKSLNTQVGKTLCCSAPALLSLIVPVSGLLAPAESLPEFAHMVPVSNPGAKISLLYLPRGSQVGFTSWDTMVDVKPLPPSTFHFSGTSSDCCRERRHVNAINFLCHKYSLIRFLKVLIESPFLKGGSAVSSTTHWPSAMRNYHSFRRYRLGDI